MALSEKFLNVSESPMDPEDVSRIALFEALIGNTDWTIRVTKDDRRFQGESGSATGLWNIKILEMKNGKWIPFPQDFNLAFINSGTSFFILNEKIYKVASRASREKIKADFVKRKAQLMKLTDSLSDDPEGREAIKKMLENFYLELGKYQEE